MDVNGVPIEDTYCEAFDGLVARMIVTAKNERLLMKAARSATALPSAVLGGAEGGIEKALEPDETPDSRPGVVIQLWVNYGKSAAENLEKELGARIRQGILVVPTTRVFNALNSENTIDMMRRVGHCGDGYELVEERFGRELINIPLMMGDFLIEKKLGIRKGVMGGNVWFFCSSEDSALDAGEKAVRAVEKVDGAITPFDVCSAGSKVETHFPEIGPTTNHPFCPTLKNRINGSKVPKGVESIPEVVINGLDLDSVRAAMRAAIRAGAEAGGVKGISAGNYGGKLGRYHIHLRELV
ncbi:MAG: formylmethanofuran--tetrahydromethanopterin N-formyltransferase [candidate division WOR-3 bacterium]